MIYGDKIQNDDYEFQYEYRDQADKQCPVGFIVSDEVQFYIEMAYVCEKLNCLPAAGGLFDQDMNVIAALTTIWNERDSISLEKSRRESER